jgi:membrane dipeptidase
VCSTAPADVDSAMPEAPPDFQPRIDGHLDLAFNAVALGRDLDLPLDALREREGVDRQSAMCTWPELVRGGLDVVVATLFARPAESVPMQSDTPRNASPLPEPEGYRDAEGAHAQAAAQLDYYLDLERRGVVTILRHHADLTALAAARRHVGRGAPIGLVVLMEGADPIRTPDEVAWWWERGVRLVGPAWQRTRYAGGTRTPGGLTDLGRELMREMRSVGMALDVSHLADASLHEALALFDGPVVASHSNARALTPADRHLDDGALRALAARDAVVGIVLGNAFLDGAAAREGRPVRLAAVGAQAAHVAGIVGWERVGIGSDFDGGFGAEETPVDLTRGSDFARLAEAVPAEHAASFLGLAWWRWLERSLPN